MFWNKIFPFTLKQRLALSFALLFFLSCTVVFFLTVSSLIYMKNRENFVEMGNIAQNIEKIYIMGGKYNSGNIILPGVLCPGEIQSRVLKAFPDSEILYYLTQRLPADSKKKGYLIIYLRRDRKIYEVIPLENGKFSSRSVNPDNDRRVLSRYFLLLLGEYAESNISIVIKNQNGTVFLNSEIFERSLPIEKTISRGGDFQFYRMELPDGRFVEIGKQLYSFADINRKYMETFFWILTLVALIGIIIGRMIAKRFIRGVHRMTSEMRLVTASGNYSRKISRRNMDNDQEIRELMETYNAMNEKTNILMEELKMVSNSVAHDLRTPITRISGTMEALLRNRELPDNIVSACASVTEECMHMKAMINTILDITRVNANPGVLQKTPVDLRKIAEEFCDIMSPEAEQKGVALRAVLPDQTVIVSADKMSVQRLISNLVGNALKFTDHGEIVLSLEPVTEKNVVFLKVSDTGCGIPEESLEKIFHRFYRCDASRKYPGNGLGLSLVQAFVKAHGWEIKCESKVGEGTVFTVEIPLPEQNITCI